MLTGAVTGLLVVASLLLVQPLLPAVELWDAAAVFSAHLVPSFVGAIGSAIAYNRVNGDNAFSQLQVGLEVIRQ